MYTPKAARMRMDEGGTSFLTDVLLSRSEDAVGAHEAAQRLVKHKAQMKERGVDFEFQAAPPEVRAATGNLGGLVPPQYLIDMAQTAIRSLRPTADACNMRPLPPTGMTLHLPRVTTPTKGGGSAQNTAPHSSFQQDPRVTDLEIGVKTIRGWIDLSIESLQRGVMVDDLLTQDLIEAVETQLNMDIWTGGGTNNTNTFTGLLHGNTIPTGQNITVTESTGTVKGQFEGIVDVATKVATERFRRATHLVMHPRRLGFLAKGVDTQNRPLFQALAATSANVVATATRPVPSAIPG